MTQNASQAPAVSRTAGQAFAGLFRLVKTVRPDRPIHPHGLALTGELTRTGNPAAPSGIDWLDAAGVDGVEARFSRSVGLPQTLPDVLGLALRIIPAAGNRTGPADILLASTGWRVPGRFLLRPRLDVAGATMTTLMPYRGRRGPVLLGLRTRSLPPGSLASGEWVLALHWATPSGPWRECGELRLHAGNPPSDSSRRFDPLANQPPGATAYPWTRRLRKPSYRAARKTAPPAVVRGPGGQAGRPAKDDTTSTTATGRNAMSTVSQHFSSPSADVWQVIANGWLYSGWVVGASRIRAVDAEWPQAGARLHHSVGAWPLVIDDSSRVSAVDPGRSLELVARGWPMGEARVVITLEERGDGCLVTIEEDAIRGPGKLVPKALRDAAISARNRETLRRLELMAAGGAGR
ncbi:SRPBCC domain-containing protein [Pseudarthrobacter enclensis]|uniref:SRPBCC family protein n=1 Tax=Pseudarthrobacter enclensis TaxID=993070 RepID=UPI0036C8B8B0